ncbi:hypothetical protein GF340_02960 [Candidatus Peregrinibacteria bacterium]|nr:hypothetical protein [Candidatus Peregrinibacteria bacterium]
MRYKQDFTLDIPVSNNAFDFDIRKNKKIHVPALIMGSIADVEIGDKVAFEALDDEGQIRTCRGLKNFVELKNTKPPTFIFDNHNHAFFFWHLALANTRIMSGATLIHIDQHKDLRQPTQRPQWSLTEHNLDEVFSYTNNVLNVGDFIKPALETGLIKSVHIIDSEKSLSEFADQEIDWSNTILDLDLDFFSEEMDYISSEKKVAFIKKCYSKTQLATLATSPFFIDQERAIYWLRKVLST